MGLVVPRIFVFCDAANEREELLNVLAAGITHFGRASFPDTLEAVIAVLLELSEPSPGETLTLDIRMEDVARPGEDSDIPPFHVDLGDGPFGNVPPGGVFNLALVIDAKRLPIPRSGHYRAILEANGMAISTMRFQASEDDELKRLESQRAAEANAKAAETHTH